MMPLTPFRDVLELEEQLPKAPAVSYDRAGALAYARKFWHEPCDDRFIALGPKAGRDFVKVDPGAVFEHEDETATRSAREHAVLADGSRIEWKDLDDCTHFISCCIGERPGEAGGGLPITYKQLGEPPSAPYGIVRVGTMVDYLVYKRKFAELVAEKSTDDSKIGELAFGDLVAYFNTKLGFYSHLAILLGGGKIACHTYCRSDQPGCTWDNVWDLGRDTHTWTFIRIVV